MTFAPLLDHTRLTETQVSFGLMLRRCNLPPLHPLSSLSGLETDPVWCGNEGRKTLMEVVQE